MDDTKVWDRLFEILDAPDENDVAYIYLIDNRGKPIKPYLLRWWCPTMELIYTLQSDYGGGEFRILIRRGKRMVFSGDVAMAPLPHRRQLPLIFNLLFQ